MSSSSPSSRTVLSWLEGDNAWRRDTAARLIYERRDEALSAPLARLAVAGRSHHARLRALWCLRGLGHDTADLLLVALGDRHPRVREQAVRLADQHCDNAQVRGAVARLSQDADARVRFRVALFLAGLPAAARAEVDAGKRLADLVVSHPVDDVWLRRAVKLAAGADAAAVAGSIMRRSAADAALRRSNELTAFLEELAALAGRLSSGSAQSELLARLLELGSSDEGYRRQLAGIRGLLAGRAPLAKLLRENAELTTRLNNFWAQTRDHAARAGSAFRLPAIRLLAHHPPALPTLAVLVKASSPGDVRLAAIGSLGRMSSLADWKTLLEGFQRESPAIRRAILDGLLASSRRTELLLDAIEQGRVKPAEVDRVRTNRLLRHGNAGIKARAVRLFADSIPAGRREVLKKYRRSLALSANPSRGRVVFQKNCATCHRIGKIGVDVAPDIADSRTRTREALLTDILQPNRAIDSNYVSYSVRTEDGKVLNGILAAETSTSITLRQPENKTLTLLRSEIEELRSDGVSLMPVGLEKNIDLQQMADLIAFIKNWRYLDGRTPLSTPRRAAKKK